MTIRDLEDIAYRIKNGFRTSQEYDKADVLQELIPLFAEIEYTNYLLYKERQKSLDTPITREDLHGTSK